MEHSVEFSKLWNSSFQNKTTFCFPSGRSTASRKRGIAAALQDATNMLPEDDLNSKRRCKEGAAEKCRNVHQGVTVVQQHQLGAPAQMVQLHCAQLQLINQHQVEFVGYNLEFPVGKQGIPSMSLENTTLENNVFPACENRFQVGKQRIPNVSLENTTLENNVF